MNWGASSEPWSACEYHLAPCWIVVHRARCAVLVAFGDLGTDDVHAILARLGSWYAHRPALLLTDLAGVGGDGVRFAVGQVALTMLQTQRAPSELRCLMVRPDGIAGMMLAGFEAMLESPMPLSLYGSRSAALDSLREDDLGEVLPLVAEADRLAASQAWWASIRRVLSSDPALSAGDLSRSIGWSERTLQRRLEAAGSSFRQERHRARMEMAVELLSVGHDKVASIAKATGFASESQFCRAFRAYAGQTPSELRQASERAAESQLAATEARAS